MSFGSPFGKTCTRALPSCVTHCDFRLAGRLSAVTRSACRKFRKLRQVALSAAPEKPQPCAGARLPALLPSVFSVSRRGVPRRRRTRALGIAPPWFAAALPALGERVDVLRVGRRLPRRPGSRSEAPIALSSARIVGELFVLILRARSRAASIVRSTSGRSCEDCVGNLRRIRRARRDHVDRVGADRSDRARSRGTSRPTPSAGCAD